MSAVEPSVLIDEIVEMFRQLPIEWRGRVLILLQQVHQEMKIAEAITGEALEETSAINEELRAKRGGA